MSIWEDRPMPEESVNTVEQLVEKLELLSGEQAEKNFPGLKEKFDALKEQHSSGKLSEKSYWYEAGILLGSYSMSQAKLDRILEGR